ncbi:MAG: hypothetical protein GY755_23275 [Chloroflexi bacterium]|nr:hypothetical protein [Chloroflexota bacterium]
MKQIIAVMIMIVLSTAVFAERTEDEKKGEDVKKVEKVDKEKKEDNTYETL